MNSYKETKMQTLPIELYSSNVRTRECGGTMVVEKGGVMYNTTVYRKELQHPVCLFVGIATRDVEGLTFSEVLVGLSA